MKFSEMYNEQEKISFLGRSGYCVRLVKKEMAFSAYHHQIEKETREVNVVYLGSTERLAHPQPADMDNFFKMDHVDCIFNELMRRKLLSI